MNGMKRRSKTGNERSIEQGVRRPSTADLVIDNAKQLYRRTIGHPLGSGKGRHEYAAQLRPDGGSPSAMQSGAYGPVQVARDVVSAAKDTSSNYTGGVSKRKPRTRAK